MEGLEIQCAERLGVLLTKEKRIKILVGGRGSSKSTFAADMMLSNIASGKTWCGGREFLNSIDDSVHSLLVDEIARCNLSGFRVTDKKISHVSGGRVFYRGLSRNFTSLKGLNVSGGLWIEEGELLSEGTLRVLTASIRASAREVDEALRQGKSVDMPEIWITLNRGSVTDPISVQFLSRADRELAKCGYYEDDMVMIVQINYDENPWFVHSGLEDERADNEKHLTSAEYAHKWLGEYADSIQNAIILPEWFDSAIDAHKKLKMEARGQKIVSYDPSDIGHDSGEKRNSADAQGLVCRHGSIVYHVEENYKDDVNDGCDWALNRAIEDNADMFVWDSDGLGVSLRRQVAQTLDGKWTSWEMFKGSSKVENPNEPHAPDRYSSWANALPNVQIFRNLRAQKYWQLRERFQATHRAITTGKYTDPEELISIDSKIGEEVLRKLRAEVCKIPKKENPNGMIQIMSKVDIYKKYQLKSPNLADSLMMSLMMPPLSQRMGARPVVSDGKMMGFT